MYQSGLAKSVWGTYSPRARRLMAELRICIDQARPRSQAISPRPIGGLGAQNFRKMADAVLRRRDGSR